MGKMRNALQTIFWQENLQGRDKSEDLSIDSMIIKERVLEKTGRKLWT
jgi:hypothetical protein